MRTQDLRDMGLRSITITDCDTFTRIDAVTIADPRSPICLEDRDASVCLDRLRRRCCGAHVPCPAGRYP